MDLEKFAQNLPIKDFIKKPKEVEMYYNEIIGMSIWKDYDDFINYIELVWYEDFMNAINYFFLMRNLVDLNLKDI